MSAEQLLQAQREALLCALCCSGTAEALESVLDRLLAWDVLQWEDYQNVRLPNWTLYSSARELLDLMGSKGDVSCGLLLAALNQVLPEAQKAALFLGPYSCPHLGEATPGPAAAAQVLQSDRPRLVGTLRGHIAEALKVLVESGCMTTCDCDDVQLPIYTPSQQARRLLDLVRSKGESTAQVLLQFVQQTETLSSWQRSEKSLPAAELLRYQMKLRRSVAAQSHFLITYGGSMSGLSLDDIYTEGVLEVAHGCDEAQRPLGLEDILGPAGTLNHEADMVLVSGEAGCGKSTLLQRLHLLWARGAALDDWLLLFPFSCRRLSAEDKELSLRDLLFVHCCWPDGGEEALFRFILDNPHRVLFTFDGLDEFRLGFSDERRLCCPTQPAPVPTLLFSLLQGCLMQGVRKVVTSRPEVVDALLRRYTRKEVLLKGFSPEGIDCFLRKHHCDPSVTTHVLEFLRSNPALFGLCHIPVLCWIVSRCYRELLGSGCGQPQTITDIYIMVVQHFLQRRSPQQFPQGSAWEGGHALRLGQLAFWGLESTRYVFSDRDLQTFGVTEEDISTGFLVVSKAFSALSGKQYEFLHVTMQCFFAAFFVVFSNNVDRSIIPKLFHPCYKEQSSLASACLAPCLFLRSRHEHSLGRHMLEAEKPNLQITAAFVSGLLSQRHLRSLLQPCSATVLDRKHRQVSRFLSRGLQKHFRSIPQPVEGEKKSMHAMPEFVWLIKCIHEFQEESIAHDAVARLEVEHLKLTYCNIGPVECSALSYVLQHLRRPVGLQLDYNSVGDVGLEQLLPCLRVCHSLYLRNNNISDEGIRKLAEKAVHSENFQKIALFNNKLTNACMKHFSDLLKVKQNFLSLRLGNNYITAGGAEQLAEGLRQNHSLQYLGLWGNKIKDRGAEAVAQALENNSSLVWLSLVDNGVGCHGARALAQLIRSSRSLEELWLTKNCIRMEGAECLLRALQTNTSMKSVWLKGNELNPEEEEELKRRDNRLVF